MAFENENEKQLVDFGKARDEVRKVLHRTLDSIMDAVAEHAEEDSTLSLRRVKEAIENNGWTLDDLDIEVDLSELDLEAVAYEHGSQSLVNAAIENENADNVLGYVLDSFSDKDEVLSAMTDNFTADEFADFMMSNLLDSTLSWGNRMTPEKRVALGRLLLVDQLAAEAMERDSRQCETPPVPPIPDNGHSTVNVEALRASVERELRAKIEAESRLKVMQEVMTLLVKAGN